LTAVIKGTMISSHIMSVLFQPHARWHWYMSVYTCKHEIPVCPLYCLVLSGISACITENSIRH